MALYGAFSSSMMAMMSQSYALNVIGTNVANVSTVGYKRSEVEFSSLLSRTINNTSDLGGITPNTYQRIDDQGSITASSRNLDTAIGGSGFYVLNSAIDGSGDTYYTRNGSFQTVTGDTINVTADDGVSTIQTQEAYLTDQNGYYVMGWQPGTDGTFATTGSMSAMRVDSYAFQSTGIPTTLATLDLNLPASDAVGSTHSYSIPVFDSAGNQHVVDLSFEKQTGNNSWTVTPSWSNPPTAQVDTLSLGGTIEAGDQYSLSVNGTTVIYTVAGTETSIADVRDGLISLINNSNTLSNTVTPVASGTAGLTLTANNAGTAFTTVFSATQGLSDTAQVDNVVLGGTVETGDIYTVTIDGTAVNYTVLGTDSTLADIRDGLINNINLAGLGVTASISTATSLDLTADVAGTAFTSSAGATDGGGTADETTSLTTTTTNYAAVADNTATASTTTANSDGIVSGTASALTFDSNGNLTAGSPIALNASWTGGGTLSASLDLSLMSQYSGDFTPHSYDQNGFGAGLLQNISFDATGQMVGSFTNAETRPLYRLGLAQFANPNGLEALNGNIYRESPDSGTATIFAPAANSFASISPNSLEQSNVTIEDEFSTMIMTQNAYNSASTVFRTIDEMTTVARDLKR